MNNLELSVMLHGPLTMDELRPWLERFEADHRCHVHVTTFTWETAWAEIVKMALYGHGPDISEVGTTWVSNLIAMRALRPFGFAEIAALGGPGAFLAGAWQTGTPANEPQTWAIPMMADTRLLYYRRDWFAKAGVDEATAFQTHERLVETFDKLEASGVGKPWAVPTNYSLTTLHYAASWVWAEGGDFISADGRAVLFHQPPALAGFQKYFDLYRHLAVGPNTAPGEAETLFQQGGVAVVVSGPWLANILSDPKIGVALPPGVPFLGGSNLVVWKHTRRAALAIEMVKLMTSLKFQLTYPGHIGQMPTKVEALKDPAFTQGPIASAVARVLPSGRTFPSGSLWGLVEDKLTAEMEYIWRAVLAEPQPDVAAILHQHLDPLAKRLELTLKAER